MPTKVGFFSLKIKNRKNGNLSFRLFRLINLIDAVLSVLTLQNALIVLNGEMENDMFILSCVTSTIGILLILFFIAFTLYKGIKYHKNN